MDVARYGHQGAFGDKMNPLYDQRPDLRIKVISRSGAAYIFQEPMEYESTRSMEQPAAQATIALAGTTFELIPGQPETAEEYKNAIHPYDIVHVTFVAGDGKEWTDIYGLVKKITTMYRDQGGVPNHATQIEVVGLGDILARFLVFWHASMRGKAFPSIQFMQKAGQPISGGPHEVCAQLFHAWFNDGLELLLADNRLFDQVVKLMFSEFPDSFAVTPLKAMNLEGTLWQALKKYSDPPFGELHVQIYYPDNSTTPELDRIENLGDRPLVGLYLRPAPFTLGRWTALSQTPGWSFAWDDEERVGTEVIQEFDSDQIYSWFWCAGAFAQGRFDQLLKVFNDSGQKIPITFDENRRRYGFRKFEEDTIYVEALRQDAHQQSALTTEQKRKSKNGKTKVWEHLAQKNAELALMFGYERMASGSVTLRGRIGLHKEHGLRIGSVIKRNRDGHEFYVQAMTQNWSMGGLWTTSLQLVRGHDPKAWREWYQNTWAEIQLNFLQNDLDVAVPRLWNIGGF